MLMGIAYRILGSYAEAEDVLQDTYIKWGEAERASIENPSAWLTTVCTRLCLDVLKAARNSRTDYVGTWLPEPVVTAPATNRSAEEQAVLASSLGTAFMLLLERLSPKERAAYLLHDLFDYDYAEVAETIGVSQAACRKLASRARQNVRACKSGHLPAIERQEQLLFAFQTAIESGSAAGLRDLLAEEATLRADSGGKVVAIRDTLHGKAQVIDFVTTILGPAWSKFDGVTANLNGQLALVFADCDTVRATVTFGFDARGFLRDIYIMRNPDKLKALHKEARISH